MTYLSLSAALVTNRVIRHTLSLFELLWTYIVAVTSGAVYMEPFIECLIQYTSTSTRWYRR